MSGHYEMRTDEFLPESIKTLCDSDLQTAKPDVILYRMLSTKSYISTISSNAAVNQQTHEDIEQRTFKHIGSGQCGTVYALIGTTEVVKVVNLGKKDDLWDDAKKHKQIEEAFGQAPLAFRHQINLPRFGKWVNLTDRIFWDAYAQYFPETFQPTFALIASRIFALPFPVRVAIFDAFAAKSLKKNKDNLLSKPENKNCLVRIYLGRRLTGNQIERTSISLRNFPLHVNDMEYLGLDTHMYARIMAQALAILHWKTGVDANDVEFVLGSAPKLKAPACADEMNNSKPEDTKFHGQDLDPNHRSVGMWLLDFNQCSFFSKDDAELKKLVDGFFWNDPSYPRPVNMTPADKKLWGTFKKLYMETSNWFTKADGPKTFIQAVEKVGKRRSQSAAGSLFG